jgi:enterochelin esterase-like enzyme
MRHINPITIHLSSILLTFCCQAQHSEPVISPEVHPDNSVTFRLHAPNVQKVLFARDGTEPIAMQKDTEGVWSVTTDPMEPDIYGYSFVADGVDLFDPSNPVIKVNLMYTQSLLHVPGPDSLPWELTDVPHGIVHHHYYKSNVVGDERDFFVYTPPGYDPKAKRIYPTLYLLHGYSDDASAWTAVGRAHFILDNLIARGKARPMLVIMPLGYGAPEIVTRTASGLQHHALRDRNYEKFRETLLKEIIPEVEKSYLVSRDRESRAIAGLSMGGTESLFTGLNALDRFASVGAFSSGGLDQDFDAMFPTLSSSANHQLRLLWVSCGTDDRLIEINRKLFGWLDSKGVRYTRIETAGSHTWMVWRRNLGSFVQLLFQEPER